MAIVSDHHLFNKIKSLAHKLAAGFFIFFPIINYSFAAPLMKSLPRDDAESVKKQLESQLPPTNKTPIPQKPSRLIEAETAPAESARDSKQAGTPSESDSIKFSLKRFTFKNTTLIELPVLEAACKEFLEIDLNLDDLEDIKARVIATYRKEGFIVDVIFPEQDLTDGVLTLEMVEAKVGRFIIMTDDDIVLSENLLDRIRGAVLNHNAPGTPLNLNNFEKIAILTNDLYGVVSTPSIKAGEQIGTTDLILKISKRPTFRGLLMTDNGGVAAEFKKLSTQFFISSLFNRGEQIAVSSFLAPGSVYGRMGITTPITLWEHWNGTMWEINTTRMQYKIDSSKVLEGLEPPSGKSYSIGTELTQPLYRSINANLWVSGGYLMRESADKDRNIYDTDTKITTGKVYSLGVSGNYFDAFLMGGVNQFSLKVFNGNSQYLGNQSTVETSNQDGAAGRFWKTSLSLARQQSFVNSWSLTNVFTAQNANKNLESAEKFTLGGANAIRAFPNSEGSGSRGVMLRNDLTKSFSDDFQASVFYDWGWVQRYVIRKGSQGQALPSYDNEANSGSMSGYGFNMNYNPHKDFNLNITFAKRAKPNPFALQNDPEKNGKDTDGTLIFNRWWITMNYKF